MSKSIAIFASENLALCQPILRFPTGNESVMAERDAEGISS